VVTGARQSEGPKPGNNRPKGVPQAEADVLVLDYLTSHLKENPDITRDAIATATGVSGGAASAAPAWKALRKRRKAKAKPRAREVPLTDAMRSAIPNGCKMPDELAALIEEQEADEAADARRPGRNH